MVRDVEYAFFAQLSYLNWNNIEYEEFRERRYYKDKMFLNFLMDNDIWKKIKRDDLEPELINDIWIIENVGVYL